MCLIAQVRKNKQNQKEQQSVQEQKIKPQEISDLEEKKWLGQIQDKKTPVLLKKVQTKNEDNSSNPW